jgi:CubicO group peptidase (beta-lactamase class C family)
MHHLTLAIVPLLCVTLASSCAPPLAQADELADYILQQMNTYHLPGLAACIVDDDEYVWSGAYGWANIEDSLAVEESTLFMLASVSKTVAATALMQLYDQGEFELDQDINDFLSFSVSNPGFPAMPITFRMLLTHTSTIRDNWTLIDTYWGGDSPVPLGLFLYDYLDPGGELYVPAGNYYSTQQPSTVHHYSNVAIALAGHLVEVITDVPFDEQCRASIFEPLSMNETSWFLAGCDTTHVAMPYTWDISHYVTYGHFGFTIYPAGQLRTSVDQLARFLITYIEGGAYQGTRILESSTVDLMLTPQIPAINPSQGLAWFYGNQAGRSLWGHNGATFGTATRMHFDPTTGIGVIVLSNGESHTGLRNIENALFDHAENLAAAVHAGGGVAPTTGAVLYQNAPNPFNPATTISFELSRPARVELEVYDVTGRLVATLLDGELPRGVHEVWWNATDPGLPAASSGVYLYRMDARSADGTWHDTNARRMTLIR